MVEAKNKKQKYSRRKETSARIRDRSEWIDLSVPAIISKEKFELVQEIKKKNFKIYGNPKFDFILGGILKCGECGSRMGGCPIKNKGS